MGSTHHSMTTSQHWHPSTHQSCTSPSWSPTHKRITPSLTPRSESSITERKNLAIFSLFWNMQTIWNAWTSVSQWSLCSLALQKNFWNHATASSMAEHRGIVGDGGNIDAGGRGGGSNGGHVLWGLRSKRASQISTSVPWISPIAWVAGLSDLAFLFGLEDRPEPKRSNNINLCLEEEEAEPVNGMLIWVDDDDNATLEVDPGNIEP